ncbi:vacuolar protein 8 [Selaginella moellendorffii]|nr:vacuolar protein 8 [Selaginella moellendorffii]|eukprot:XP_002982376.2 vacuolar protein 8 [Selaginella moellendorffii]
MVTAREQEHGVLDRGGGEGLLEQAQSLVAQIVAASSSVKAFLVRWKMIISRLERLPDLLTELGGAPFFAKNTLCLELLESLVASLGEGLELVSQCALPSYGGGKLQMQSRLDSLASRLDGYLHDSRLMIETGVLCQASPLMTLSVMGVSKESRKWTVKDLLARLQMGSTESRIKALDSLVEFMAEDDKNVLVVAAAPGSIPALVHLLDGRAPVMREKAAAAVASLATVESCVHEIVSEGALQSLVRLLDPARGSLASERAARALQSLTLVPDNARSVAACGGVSPLLDLCRSGTPVAQAVSASVLRNLSAVEEIRRRISEEEESLQVLIYLLSSGTPHSREHAAVALQNLAAMDDDNFKRALVWSEGVLEPLARFLDGSEAPASQEAGIGILRGIASSPATVPAILEAGFLHPLVGFLTQGSPCVQQCAAAAVAAMAVCSESRRAIGDAGCIAPLVRMLDAKMASAQEHAVSALANLVELESNRRMVASEEKGISGIVRLLDTSGSPSLAAERAVAALIALAGNSKNRKQIMASGACYYLGRLVEGEVPGAKKLLEKLEGGKFRSFLKRLDISSE